MLDSSIKNISVDDSLDLFIKRRSCRNFKSIQVESKILDSIIYAGRLAPSAHGLEDTITLVIEDHDIRKKLEDRTSMFMSGFKNPFYGAPHVLAVLSSMASVSSSGCGYFDGALVLGNMMLAATLLGIGSCWINTAQFDTALNDSILLNLLESKGYGREFVGIGYLVLGYPASDQVFNQIPKTPKQNRILKI